MEAKKDTETAVTGQGRTQSATDRCPACGGKARRLKPITLLSSLTETSKTRLDAAGDYRFCKSGSCEVVYFHEKTGERFIRRDLKVPIFQKSMDPSRTVCYCFEHTVAGIVEEVRRTGTSKVPEEIAEKCRRGLDRCEELNPQGACCLGNVKQVVQNAKEESKMAEVVYECASDADQCEKAEFDEHPDKEPQCCGRPMKKTRDTCCESSEPSDGCC